MARTFTGSTSTLVSARNLSRLVHLDRDMRRRQGKLYGRDLPARAKHYNSFGNVVSISTQEIQFARIVIGDWSHFGENRLSHAGVVCGRAFLVGKTSAR